MRCDRCEHEPCTCESGHAKPYLTKACSHPGCHVVIRWPVGELQGDPLCKWHQEGQPDPYAKDWPPGMPDPHHPWPWLDEAERQRRIALPFWQSRFRTSKDPRYHQYLAQPLPETPEK